MAQDLPSSAAREAPPYCSSVISMANLEGKDARDASPSVDALDATACLGTLDNARG
jgi:hypothetical protein